MLSSHSEQWCLLLRGQASHGGQGVGRDGHLPEQKDIEIPEHYNVSRSLLHEMRKANEEQTAAAQEQQAAADRALALDDEDNPLPEHARSGYMQNQEEAVQEGEADAISSRVSRAGAAKSKGARAIAKTGLRLSGGGGSLVHADARQRFDGAALEGWRPCRWIWRPTTQGRADTPHAQHARLAGAGPARG